MAWRCRSRRSRGYDPSRNLLAFGKALGAQAELKSRLRERIAFFTQRTHLKT